MFLKRIGQRIIVLTIGLLAVMSGRSMSQQRAEQEPIVRRIKGVNYPRLANLAGIQGAVELVAKVSVGGTIENVRVVSGQPLLVDAAKDALQGWQFRCLDPSNSCEVKVAFTFKLLNELCDKSSCPSELEIDLPNAVTVRAKRLRAIVD